MTEKQINKWLRRRFSAVSWVLLAYFALMNVLVYVAMAADVAKQTLWSFGVGDFSMTVDMDAVLGNAWGYIAAIGVGALILHAWKGRDYWQTLLQRKRAMKAGVFFCLVSLCIGAQMVNSLWVSGLEAVLNGFGKSVLPLLESVSGQSDTLSMFLYASILAPVFEEVLFRGYVLRTLEPYGKRFAIFGSALLFGLFHGNLLQTPYAYLAGLLLGYTAVEYSLPWAIALHMFNNFVLADLLTRLTAGLSDMAYGLVNLVLLGGFSVVSLVILVKKRREIRAYRQSEWMDRRCLKCFVTNLGFVILAAITVCSMAAMLYPY